MRAATMQCNARKKAGAMKHSVQRILGVEMRRAPLLLAACVLLCGFEAVTPRPTLAQEADSKVSEASASGPAGALRPGDVVEVSSWRSPDLAGEFRVDDDGEVVLPLLGRRNVTRVPADVLRRELQEEYQNKFRVEGAVQITLKRRVRIVGEVRAPGLYHADPSMTLGDVIALAGGITGAGDPRRVHIVRNGQKIVEVDLRPDAAATIDVQSGDEITVPQRGWLSRHGGVFIGAAASSLALALVRILF
jgi:protein involved in polysaccharide export with SLBB domain